ncbi:MAG: VWA domain-containing protein [Coriobacteriia bacterium]|nr:VWA domain-containing protein [Coriobacteriia bacterium]
MDRRNTHTKRTKFISALSMTLAFAMLFPAVLAMAAPVVGSSYPSATPAAFTITDRVSDPDSSKQMGFVDVPRVHDGRIWTDKSVQNGTGVDDFDITLSALSQSFKITQGYEIPADTVFVIDVSGSMGDTDAGASSPRINMLVDSLNEAMGILQDANPQNRLAVVAYGGVSGGKGRVQNLLDLGRYSAAGGEFFSVTGSANKVVNNNAAVAGSEGQVKDKSVAVEGSTPTQWGIFEGSRILEAANPLAMVEMTASNGTKSQVQVTRRPNIVLMTDGEPTLGNIDYSFSQPSGITPGAAGSFVLSPTKPYKYFGDGMYGELGVTLMTVLTAAHRKTLVFDNYFPGGDTPGDVAQPAAKVGFYTIGMGKQTDTAMDIIRATLNPTPANASIVTSSIREGMTINQPSPAPAPPVFLQNQWAQDSDYNMDQLMERFAASQETTFNASHRAAFLSYLWDEAPESLANSAGLTNTEGLGIDDLRYNDGFYEATDLDGLRDAFKSITMDIQTDSLEHVTVIGDNPDFDGWLTFSDVLGSYMQFRPAKGVNMEFDGTPYTRTGFDLSSAAVRASYAPILMAHMNYGATSGLMSLSEVQTLIDDNVNAGNTTSIVYYADANRNYLGATNPGNAAAKVEVFPMFGELDEPVVPGGQTDLQYITFHVVTALTDGTFSEIYSPAVGTGAAKVSMDRKLLAGDQMIRWYIPGSLIPMRKVSDAGVVSGNTNPIRVTYTVGLDQERVSAGVTPAYAKDNTSAAGELYFYSNRWRGEENVTFSFDQPSPKNPFYQTGRPGLDDNLINKTSNNTQTAPQVTTSSSFTYQQNLVDLHWLGNNGRLTLTTTVPPVDPPEETPPPGTTTPPDPNTPDVPEETPPTPITGPKTGDELQTSIFLMLMVMSAIFASGAAYHLKQKQLAGAGQKASS